MEHLGMSNLNQQQMDSLKTRSVEAAEKGREASICLACLQRWQEYWEAELIQALRKEDTDKEAAYKIHCLLVASDKFALHTRQYIEDGKMANVFIDQINEQKAKK